MKREKRVRNENERANYARESLAKRGKMFEREAEMRKRKREVDTIKRYGKAEKRGEGVKERGWMS